MALPAVLKTIRWTSVIVILIGLSLWAYFTFLTPLAANRCRGCNVIVISIDTLGAKHTTLGDPSLDTTPFLSELASRSVVFNNAFSQAPWTLPSHTAMLTGLYPWALDVWLATDVLPDKALTLAEMLKPRGYTTAAFSDGAFVRPEWHFDQGFDEFYGSTDESAWKDAPAIFDKAAAWLGNRKSSKPFFLFIRPFEVHDPYVTADKKADVTLIARANAAPNGASAEAAAYFQKLYHDQVSRTDAALRAFFDKLDASGLSKKTLIIITADHGEEFGEHGSAGIHGSTLYREVIHVPLVVVAPTHPNGMRIPESVEIRSIPATVLDYLGMRPDPALAESLLPLIAGVESGDRVVLSATAHERGQWIAALWNGYPKDLAAGIVIRDKPYAGTAKVSAIKGDTEVIRNKDGLLEIYDMKADPDEKTNLDTPAYSKTLNSDKISELIDAFAGIIPK